MENLSIECRNRRGESKESRRKWYSFVTGESTFVWIKIYPTPLECWEFAVYRCLIRCASKFIEVLIDGNNSGVWKNKWKKEWRIWITFQVCVPREDFCWTKKKNAWSIYYNLLYSIYHEEYYLIWMEEILYWILKWLHCINWWKSISFSLKLKIFWIRYKVYNSIENSIV